MTAVVNTLHHVCGSKQKIAAEIGKYGQCIMINTRTVRNKKYAAICT